MSDDAGSRSRAWEPVLIAAGAVALTAVVGSILLLAGGHSPVAAAAALVNGSVGSKSWNMFHGKIRQNLTVTYNPIKERG